MEHSENLYESVGVSAGQTGEGLEVVGLLLPKENPMHDEDFDELFFTLTAAKGLLIDLQDAIDAAVKHKSDPE